MEEEYKCIKEIWLEKYDGDGFSTEEYGCVPIGSIWMRDDAANIVGGEVHLECIDGADGFGWIEITESDLVSHFEPVN